VKLLAVSDLRVQPTAVLARVVARERPDLIVYGGDDVARFGPGPASWAEPARLARHGLVGILGNDCEPGDSSAFDQPGCRNLGAAPVMVDGLAFVGLPGAPEDEAGGLGSLLYTRESARRHLASQLRTIGDVPFVLVSHTPPRGILDTAIRFGAHAIGSSVVREFVDHPRCRAVICGHVHSEGGRERKVGGCAVVNIASHDAPGSALRYAILSIGSVVTTTFGEEREHHESTRLPGVGPRRAALLAERGILTIADVVSDDTGSLEEMFGGSADRLRLQAAALTDGVARVTGDEFPVPDDGLYIDVETSHDRVDQPWLIGLSRPKDPAVIQLEELDPDAHSVHLERLDDLVRSTSFGRIVSWGAADRGVLRTAFRLHRGCLPNWLESDWDWVDACQWTKRALILPLESAKLKVVAPWCGFQFRHVGIEGVDVGKMYARWRDDRVPFDRDLIRSYNKDDVMAVRHIVQYVNTTMRAQAGPAGALPAQAPMTAVSPVVAGRRGSRLTEDQRIARQIQRYAEALWERVVAGGMTIERRDDAIEAYARVTRNRAAIR
jgi:Icc-related predicted phosphoesterase